MSIGVPFDPNTGMWTSSIIGSPSASASSGVSPNASVSPSASVSPNTNATIQALQQALQNNSLITNGGAYNYYNAKYTPPIPTWSNTFITAGPIGPSGVGGVNIYDLPKGSAPIDRLKRALMLAGTNGYLYSPTNATLPAYSPGCVKDISKLDKLRKRITKDICTVKVPSYGAGLASTIHTMAIKMPGAPPLFTQMTFRECPYATTTSIDTDNDIFTIPNNLLFIASQHKEFSIGVIQYDDEDKRDEILKNVKEFVDGFCDINIKPLMANLIQVFMGNVVFLAPSKRIASLAKAVFDVKYITVRTIPKYKDEHVALPVESMTGQYTTGSIGCGISGGAGSVFGSSWGGLTAGPISQPNLSSTNITWTKLQNSFTKLGNSMTNATTTIKNYFTSNNVSS